MVLTSWPPLRLQCHRRDDFRKDLFKWASSESLLLVCFIHFLAWFYSWKIECDVRAGCILLLKKYRRGRQWDISNISINYFSRRIFRRNVLYKDSRKCWSWNSGCRFLRFDTAMKNMETKKKMTVETSEHLNSIYYNSEWAYFVESEYVYILSLVNTLC